MNGYARQHDPNTFDMLTGLNKTLAFIDLPGRRNTQ